MIAGVELSPPFSVDVLKAAKEKRDNEKKPETPKPEK
jgi:hypothetical protein